MKSVLVTGTSSGIGAAVVNHFESAGWNVASAMRTPIEDHRKNVMIVPMDITDVNAVNAGIESVISNFGSIDVLVNNAGYGETLRLFEETSNETIKAQMETNMFGGMNLCRAVLPHMRQNGRGHIINITSIASTVGFPYNVSYCSSKFAFKGFSLALAEEVEHQGIYVTAFEPGVIKAGIAFKMKLGRDIKIPELQVDFDKLTASAEKIKKMYASRMATDPNEVARRLFKLANKRKPPTVAFASHDARMLNFLKRILPLALFRKIARMGT